LVNLLIANKSFENVAKFKMFGNDSNKSKLDLREIRQEGVDWMHLAKDRDQWSAPVNMVKNLQVP
jgi:hypothetical protein